MMSLPALTKAWLLLLGLTALTMGAAVVQARLLPLPLATGLVLALAGFKAWMILSWYLGLRTAPAGWRVSFTLGVFGLCAALFAIQMIGWGRHP